MRNFFGGQFTKRHICEDNFIFNYLQIESSDHLDFSDSHVEQMEALANPDADEDHEHDEGATTSQASIHFHDLTRIVVAT